ASNVRCIGRLLYLSGPPDVQRERLHVYVVRRRGPERLAPRGWDVYSRDAELARDARRVQFVADADFDEGRRRTVRPARPRYRRERREHPWCVGSSGRGAELRYP